jgi:hypothetical protein
MSKASWERTWEFGLGTTIGGVIAALIGGPWWALGTIVVTGFGDAFVENVGKKFRRSARAAIKSDPDLYAKWLEQHPDMPL